VTAIFVILALGARSHKGTFAHHDERTSRFPFESLISAFDAANYPAGRFGLLSGHFYSAILATMHVRPSAT